MVSTTIPSIHGPKRVHICAYLSGQSPQGCSICNDARLHLAKLGLSISKSNLFCTQADHPGSDSIWTYHTWFQTFSKSVDQILHKVGICVTRHIPGVCSSHILPKQKLVLTQKSLRFWHTQCGLTNFKSVACSGMLWHQIHWCFQWVDTQLLITGTWLLTSQTLS